MLTDERMGRCALCGQPLSYMRLGVRMGPIKARIFDILNRAGPAGVDADELFWLIYRDRTSSRAALKSNVWRLNELLRDTGVQIKGERGHGRWFRMVDQNQKRAAS